MDSMQNYLLELSDRLDKDGLRVCADAVDKLNKTASLQKLAQYVGVIGYVLKQNRAMSNCIRKKRAGTKGSMQEVVLGCLQEYQDGQDYQNTEWTSKYAQVIQHEPQKFDVAHLFFLSTVGDDLSKDIEQVEKVAFMLEENGVEEEVLASVLGHLGTLGDILSKDSETHANFKIAAPQRGRWSRFWNPGEKGDFFSMEGAWNPRTRNRNARERGQDLDTIQELDVILNDLSSLTRVTQKIKTQMSRLQSEAAGYTSGSGRELPYTDQPRQEDVDTLQNFTRKVGELQPEDWNRSVLVLQQLRHLMSNVPIQNEYNQQIFGRAKQSIDSIFASMEQVYDHVESLQDNMQTLRSREPILGRDAGITEQGRRNPLGQSTAGEEYGALQEVLERLYQNPMNSKAQWYAQKAHGRLWDKLRYIERGSDDDMQSWLGQDATSGTPDYGDEYPDETTSDETGRTPLGAMKDRVVSFDPSDEPESASVVDTERLSDLIDSMSESDILDKMDSGTFATLLHVLRGLMSAFTGEAQVALGKLYEAMKTFRDTGAAKLPAARMTATPTGTVGGAAGGAAGAGVSSHDTFMNEFEPVKKSFRLSDRFKLGSDKIHISDLVDVVDIVDGIDKNVADILDEFIKEQKKPVIDLTFPEFSVLIKEPKI